MQWRRFKRILEVAYADSPFYRQRFDEAGITPDSIKGRGDLERIPITTRDDLRNPDRLICEGYRVEDLHCSLTTGSTGRRTRTYFDDGAWVLAKHLLKMRARVTTGVSPKDRIALLQESDTVRKGSPWRERLFKVQSFSIDLPTNTLLEQLREFNPTVLYGFPSHLRRIATASADAFRISRIYTSGELLEGETRRCIESAFAAPVLDVYGCTEVKEIAWQCLERDGYHINSDWLLVEVPQNDSTRGPEGPILVTALFNEAMPVLRYEVGDTGVLLQDTCDCGRGLPLMRPTGGRTVDYFQLPDGTTVSPYAMTYALEQVQGLKQFQIVQRSPDLVTVKVVTNEDSPAAVDEQIKAHLGSALPGMTIEVRRVASLEFGPASKVRVVLSELEGS